MIFPLGDPRKPFLFSSLKTRTFPFGIFDIPAVDRGRGIVLLSNSSLVREKGGQYESHFRRDSPERIRCA